jgi:uncharacterized protein
MIGFYFLQKKGLAKPHIKPAKLAANIIGGLIFGVGFALAGYCPGTGAAALGQGNLNAFYYMGGMLVGSYFYAEVSNGLDSNVKTWMDKGKMTLPELFNIPQGKFFALFGILLTLALIVLNRL